MNTKMQNVAVEVEDLTVAYDVKPVYGMLISRSLRGS